MRMGSGARTQPPGGRTAPETRRLTDFKLVRSLYRSRLKKDFAPNELKPLSAMRRAWERGAYDCYGLFGGEEILGYAFFVRNGRDRLLDYFAIAEDCRGGGLGSAFLRQLAGCIADADCVVAEAEDPDTAPDAETRELRERRLRFYERNGYIVTGLKAVVFGADYRILEAPASAAPHAEDALRAVYTELYRSILPELFFRTQFRVSQEPEKN